MLKQKIKKTLSCVLAMTMVSASFGVTALAGEDSTVLAKTKIKDKYYHNNYFRLINTAVHGKTDDGNYYYGTKSTDGGTPMALAYPKREAGATADLSLTGGILVEARLKYSSDMTGKFHPVEMYGKATGTAGNYFSYGVSNTLYVIDGNFMVDNPARGTNYVGSNVSTVGEAKADTFYTVKMQFNIDGDSETTDKYYYSISDDNGEIYSSFGTAGGNIGVTKGGGTYNFYDTTALSAVGVGVLEGTGTVTYDYLKITNLAIPEFTSTLTDGAKGVEEGTEITLTFDKEMNGSTFSGIALKKADGTAVSGLKIKAADNKTCVVTLPDMLDSEADYKLVVPASVTATDGVGVTHKEISFTSAESRVIFYRDFSNVTVAETNALSNGSDTTGFKRNNGGFANGAVNGGLQYNIYDNSNPHGFTYHSDRDMGVKGDIVLEAKMKFSEAGNDKKYFPLAILPESGIGHSNVLYAYPVNVLKVSGGKCYISGKEICDITANTFYTFKVLLNIDGDSETTDTFYAEVSTDTESLGKGSGKLTGTYGTTAGLPALTKMTSLGGLHVVMSHNVNAAVGANVIIESAKGYYAKIPEMTSSLAEGTADVKAGDQVTLTFSEAMDTSTFKNIALQTSAGIAVNGLKYEASADGKVCTLTLPGYLESEADYKLVIPKTVISASMVGVNAKTINFKSEKHSIIFYKDIDAMDTQAHVNDDTEIKAMFIGYSVDEDKNIVFKRNRTDTAVSTVKYHKTNTLNLTGNLEFETKIKFDQNAIAGTRTDGCTLPISIVDSNAVSNVNYGFPMLLYIKDGKLYAANPQNNTASAPNGVEICAVDTSKFYTFTIRMNIDGDANTVDTYTYEVSDGTNTYSNTEGYKIGASGSVAQYNTYAITAITDVYFGATKANDASYIMEYAKITKLTAPEFDVNTIDVSVADPIVIKFTDEMNAAGFANITLAKEDGTPVDAVITPVSGVSDTCTIKVENGLSYGAMYTLTVPAIISTKGLATEMAVIPLMTEAMPEVIISAEVECGTITAGAKLNTAAVFTNELKLPQTVTLITALYNGANELQGVIAEQNITIGANGTYTHNAEFTVPSDIGDGAYVKVMAWDSLSKMGPIMIPVIK